MHFIAGFRSEPYFFKGLSVDDPTQYPFRLFEYTRFNFPGHIVIQSA